VREKRLANEWKELVAARERLAQSIVGARDAAGAEQYPQVFYEPCCPEYDEGYEKPEKP
jgi:hypothetical protein